MAADHDRKMTTVNKTWAKRLKKNLEELRMQNEDAARRVSEDHKLAMDDVTAGYMATIRKLEDRDSELSKLKRKEATRAINQGTVRDPSARVKKPSSYQETDEDEMTARDRARLNVDLKTKHSKQTEADERLRLLQQLRGKDEAK